MFDRATFLRPIAHRGLHDISKGIVENTGPAFEEAIARGYGIECDVRPAADGTPMVFHDLELGRLIDQPGKTTDHSCDALSGMHHKTGGAAMLRLQDLLSLVSGAVPLLVEVKNEWTAPYPGFLEAIARDLAVYRGPVALMSFDPSIVTRLKGLVPSIPRGIVSGVYDESWWPGHLDAPRRERLTHLIESGPAAPHFFAFDVNGLPTPVTRFLREGLGIPLFTWTVRDRQQLASARSWADAPIFEDIDPDAQ